MTALDRDATLTADMAMLETASLAFTRANQLRAAIWAYQWEVEREDRFFSLSLEQLRSLLIEHREEWELK
jgi:hypothetical protein